ncbi:hypothetical protein FNH22_12835 [Fulvivirga sp. M361]|uniref:hypothetical protein n=1 Tax=Fulvivirga sp. M361 TaxID=2594266 RepID=UPI00117B1332|nr:hypothetical protein [Fulvivirga sp. M361]TRX58756.1 hypothetical protein FNH22_12835 [Fulvivirga sp. M361]
MIKSTGRQIVLTFSLNQQHNDKYQGIYYAHLLGSTFAIGAKFKHDLTSGFVNELTADFTSKTMGGIINFALDSIDEKIKFDSGEGNLHYLGVKLNIFRNQDQHTNPKTLTFDQPFDINNHTLRIKIDYTKDCITNYEEGMVNFYTEDVNNDRSCDIRFTPS